MNVVTPIEEAVEPKCFTSGSTSFITKVEALEEMMDFFRANEIKEEELRKAK